jgi:hypothetical protein
MASLEFFLAAIFGMFLGRKLGWFFTRSALYPSPDLVAAILSIGWGILIAMLMTALIRWLHPYWIIKFIFGYFLGAYVAVPNYGLLRRDTAPDHARIKDNLISILSMWAYIILVAILAFV